jgi:hypothetical protein
LRVGRAVAELTPHPATSTRCINELHQNFGNNAKVKLAAKFTLMLIVAVLALIAVDGYLVMRQEIRMLDEDLERDAILFRERIEPIIQRHWEDWRGRGSQQISPGAESSR